jgi:uncharacterized membrane protein YkvA (DUF1232 family)
MNTLDVLRVRCRSTVVRVKEQVRLIRLESYTLAYAYRDRRTPWLAKLAIVITLGYLLSPIDLIPDCIPVFGYLDDLVLVPLMIVGSIKLIPNEVVTDARDKARAQIDVNRRSKKTAWWCALSIVLFYATLVVFVGYRLAAKYVV